MSVAMIPREGVFELMARFDVPGVAVGVVHGDRSEVVGFGVTSFENPLPVAENTLFQIGSITKTFTATAAMRLVEAGSLDLDQPVRSYLPDLRMADETVARRVTMRHLLTHTGGWVGDYFNSIGRGDDALSRMVARLDQLEQLTPLGAVWSYNNAGFYIAGRVIEVIAGTPYEDALRSLLLEPLGLKRAFFHAEDLMTYRFAVGHDRSGTVLREWSLGRPAAAIGGLITTAPDLLRYASLQWNPDGILSEESLAEMRRPHADTGGLMGDEVGLGWYRFERNGMLFLRHGGSTNGQNAELVIAPHERFALVVLTNHDNGSAIAAALTNDILQAELDVGGRDDTPLERPEVELDEYVRTYESQLNTVRLSLADGALMLETIAKGGFPEPDSPPRQGPPPTRLAFTSRDAVTALDPPLEGARAQFLRAPDGSITWFRYGGRLYRPADRDDD